MFAHLDVGTEAVSLSLSNRETSEYEGEPV